MKELLPLSDTITYIYLLFDTTYSNQFADSNRIRKPNQVGSGSLTKELPNPHLALTLREPDNFLWTQK